ncbi:MAG: hypothetical protein N2383_11610 [Caldilineales bacterium]|nr:hypothetical protein [Caldilineales bacterium]
MVIRRRANVLTLFLLVVVLAGCTLPYPPCEPGAVVYPAGRRLAGRGLQLGVVNTSSLFPTDLATALRGAQATLAVIEDVRWGLVEPEPPQGDRHTYLWDDEVVALDSRVRAYQQAGFEPVIVLRAWNIWARAVGPTGAAVASTPPRPEYEDDYAAWVAAVVERYDADGFDDFPGLADTDGDGRPNPVRFYQIETESVNGYWWQGIEAATAVDDYLRLLRRASTAARGAYAGVRILVATTSGLDLLDGFPTPAELNDIVTNIHPSVCGALGGLRRILAVREAYDIVAVHSLADYTGLATLADWAATLTPTGTPVWITGATSAPALLGDPQDLRVRPRYPRDGEGLWNALRHRTDPNHAAVTAWYRAEQARLAFKKWVYAAAYGFEVLALGLERDRPDLENPALGQRDLAFQGLVETADGSGPPPPRPVVAALALAQAQLGGYSAVQRLADVGPPIEAFVFTVEGLPVYVLWYDDGTARLPDDPPAATTITLPVRSSLLTQLSIPTRRGQTGPDVTTVIPTGGRVTLTITETPVILRGEWVPLYWPRIIQ